MGARRKAPAGERARVGRPPKHEGKLALWIEEEGRTRQDVADELGVSRKFLDHVCREYRRPGLDLAVKIERLTRGKVPISYLVSLPRHGSD